MSMGWRLRIRHQTSVTYPERVRASYNEARMVPLTLPEQTTLESRIVIRPGVGIWQYWDYWGTQVGVFDLQDPHDRMVVSAMSVVETSPRTMPEPMDWATLRQECERGRCGEFLQPTALTTVTADLAAVARERVQGADPHEAAAEIAGWVHDSVAYVPGATGVQTSAQEAWDQRQGVCQDIAHLTVALLRVVGVPARYVSGYLHPNPDARPGEAASSQSHAWVEHWAGGWVGQDPTNRVPVGERHVVVARGRDYADVPPLKGIYHGAPSSVLAVDVEVARLA
jgi:transglutaminase-like putative cysteine protease